MNVGGSCRKNQVAILTPCMAHRTAAAISAVVVDDEQLARDELTFLLREYPEIEVSGTAENGLQAVDLIQRVEPDLVFLDVQMPGLDGMSVVRTLREQHDALPHFVFVTAYDS